MAHLLDMIPRRLIVLEHNEKRSETTMLSPSLEDYLEEAYRLSLTHTTIRIKDIADILGVTMPSVVKGLKRLHEQGYLYYRPYEEIELSAKGFIRGKFLVARNKILCDFVEIIGADCDIRQEAEAMEHYLSTPTIRAIEKLTSFFTTFPQTLGCFQSYSMTSVLDEEPDPTK